MTCRDNRGWDSQNGEQQEQATAHPADDPVGQAPVMLQHIKESQLSDHDRIQPRAVMLQDTKKNATVMTI